MAAVASFPTPFLPCPGEPSIPFDVWLKMFRNSLLVVNASGDEWPAARKRALFLHCLGTEGQRLFYTLPNQGETMEEAIEILQVWRPERGEFECTCYGLCQIWQSLFRGAEIP